MKSRFAQALLFLLPLAVAFGVPALALWLGGEFTHPAAVVRAQASSKSMLLYETAYTNPEVYLKYHSILARRPRLLVLGNSRMMQVCSAFFHPEAGFYNASGATRNVLHFRTLLDAIPRAAQPEVLIVGLDEALFNPTFHKADEEHGPQWLRERMTAQTAPFEILHKNWRAVWQGLATGKIQPGRLLTLRGLSDRRGFLALMRTAGFCNDGSYLYARSDYDVQNPAHHDYQFRATLREIEVGSYRSSFNDGLLNSAVLEMGKFLDQCRERGIHVIAITPPFPHVVWQGLLAGGRRGHLAQIDSEIRPLFEQRGFEFHDFSDFASFGAEDSEALDGYHGSESAYIKLFIALLDRGSRLKQFTSAERLKPLLGWASTEPEKLRGYH